MAKPVTKNTYINNVKKAMKKLGTYHKEFDTTIAIYGGMLYQYFRYEQELENEDYKITELYTNKAGFENARKKPIFTVIETLRKDIISYSNQLMLTPKSLGEVVDDTGDSPLLKLFEMQEKIRNDQIKKKVKD